uniref:mirror-image polydactyly gene 1 protein-like n=1 Tax=Ciona intestinalis TaxID=7719 RepID=UPI000180C1C3|nr:mirror-image polydactyly gene 1 protein-like [Ciona intestinalis]|eukprot:XP_026696299.1 mirror-image polydactyly gene 1 protein-like [Ciona intestinalis]
MDDDSDEVLNVRFGSSISEDSKVTFHKVETIRSVSNYSHPRSNGSLQNYDDTASGSLRSYTEEIVTKLQASLHAQEQKNKSSEFKIKSLETELASLKMEYEMKCAEVKQKDSERIAGMVEEIIEAQKEREASVLARMKRAVQERDEAILRAKALSMGPRLRGDENNNGRQSKLQELVSLLCEAGTGRAAVEYSNKIKSQLDNMRKMKDEITSEEMKTLICERDDAVQKWHALKCSTPVAATSNAEKKKHGVEKKNLVNACVQVNTEPLAGSLMDLSHDGKEVEMLRICYSLHKSLVENSRLVVEHAEQKDAERLVEALRIEQDHNRIQEINSRRQEEQLRRLTEKNERLERLVTVLRKKLALLAQQSMGSVAKKHQ